MDDYSIKLNEEEDIYELYLDEKLLYKAEDFINILEYIAKYETFNCLEDNNLINICNRYLNNYKKVLNLCREVML